jgi:hypothetical protein
MPCGTVESAPGETDGTIRKKAVVDLIHDEEPRFRLFQNSPHHDLSTILSVRLVLSEKRYPAATRFRLIRGDRSNLSPLYNVWLFP